MPMEYKRPLAPNELTPKDVGAEESDYTEQGLRNLKPELAEKIRARIARSRSIPPKPTRDNTPSTTVATQEGKPESPARVSAPKVWREPGAKGPRDRQFIDN